MSIHQLRSDAPDPVVRLNAAAQTALARVLTNAGKHFASMLDVIAQDIGAAIPVSGLDGATGKHRELRPEELAAGEFKHGALVLVTREGAVFTQMTVLREDLDGYFAKLDHLDRGDWPLTRP
jgi:hypothetical protein